MGEINPSQIMAAILATASGIVLISNAFEKIVKAVNAAKKPNAMQDERLHELEEWRKKVDVKLLNDHKRFDDLDSNNRVTQRALLALLGHGLNGNNIEQMQKAKTELQNHLIDR